MIIMVLWCLYIYRKTTSFGGRVKTWQREQTSDQKSRDTILVNMTVRKMYMCQHFINIGLSKIKLPLLKFVVLQCLMLFFG